MAAMTQLQLSLVIFGNDRVFARDVMAAILVSQNNEMVAILVSQTNPMGL